MKAFVREIRARIFLALCIMFMIPIFTSSAVAQTIASSGFDSDSEGWGLAGDGTSLTWQSSGGNPGGYINAGDQALGSMWLFSAPAAYLGDQSAAFGGALSYSLRVSGNNGWNTSGGDVFLVGNGIRLAAASGPVPTTSWQGYSAMLDSSGGWRLNDLNGAFATDQEIRDVLANLTTLEIRGEYFAGGDNADLDSVVMESGAPPRAVPALDSIGFIFMVLALAGFGVAAVNRRV